MAGWKNKVLSKGDRLVLLNSVLSALTVYYLSIFRIPEGVLQTIDGLRRNFLWSSGDTGRGPHLVNWEAVCTAKTKGGLGVKDLRWMNVALLGKWIWEIWQGESGLWGKIVGEKYYHNGVRSDWTRLRRANVSLV